MKDVSSPRNGIQIWLRMVVVASFVAYAWAQNISSAWIVTADGGGGHVLKLDIGSGTVLQSVATDNSPDLAVSPDGTRLYLAATIVKGNRDVLQVIDSSSGAILETVDNQDRYGKYGFFPPSDMVTSPDGRHLYILKRHSAKGEPDVTFVSAFDTSALQFTGTATVGDCASSSLNASASDHIVLVCGGANKIYRISLDSNGNPGTVKTFALPSPPPILLTHEAHATGDIRAVVWGSAPFVFLGRLDGTVWKVNSNDGTLVATSAGPIANKFIGGVGGALSQDGKLLFIACDVVGNWDGLQQSIATFDSTSLTLIGIVKTSSRFNSVAMSPSGNQLLLGIPSTKNVVSLSLPSLSSSSTMALGFTPRIMKSR